MTPRSAAQPFLTAVLALTATTLCHAGNGIGRDVHQLYDQFCAGCHGESLRGGKAESLVDDKWKYGSDDASLERNIRQGIPNAGMPSFGAAFDPAEVRAMVVFIRETAKRSGDPVPKDMGDLPTGVQSSEVQRYHFETIAEGFNVPWSIAFLPNDRILVSERVGRLRIIDHGKLSPTPIGGVPAVRVEEEGGLLSIAVPPDFATSHWVYLSFSDKGPHDTTYTKVIRARLRGNQLVEPQVIFSAKPEAYSNNGTLFGCRLMFVGDYLFFTVGERGIVGQAQDLSKPNGKVHRVYWDGRTPPDNPFVKTPGAWTSIYTYGHRNPQGLARDPRTGDIWETEHGPRGGDELNHLIPGHNYGWPVITYGMNYDGTAITSLTAKAGMEQPAAYWTPSIATSPIMFYDGDRYPRWKNALFLGSLAQQEFRRLSVDRDHVTHQELVFKHLGRIRDIRTGPDGLIYLSLELSNSKGRIVRLIPDN